MENTTNVTPVLLNTKQDELINLSGMVSPSFVCSQNEAEFLSCHVISPDIYLVSDSMAYAEKCLPVLRIHPEMGIPPKDEFERIYNLLHDQYDAQCIFSNNSLLGK
jgi:hypothetical protein